MAEVHQLPDIGEAERQASQWIARLNADDVSDSDRDRFNEWHRSHPLHARVYEEVAATWNALTALGPLVRAVSFGQAMNELSAVRKPWRRASFAAAAMVLLGIGCFYFLRVAPLPTFQTAIGEHATVALPDDSVLHLNTNTVVEVDYSERARVVRLERGEAYFEVAHDPKRPFWVVAGDSWVRAVGTAFNVYLQTEGARVTVSEGTVKVGADRLSRRQARFSDRLDRRPGSLLTAGQQGDVRADSIQIRSLSGDELSRSVGWRNGTIYFEDEPLEGIVKEIARYTTLQLVVADDALRGLRLGGTFQANADGAESFLAMLQDGLRLRLIRDRNHVYIESAASQRRQGLAGNHPSTNPSQGAAE